MSAMKACFQIAECSLSYAKIKKKFGKQMKCVLKYPKKENTKRPEPTNNFDSGRILSIVFYFFIARSAVRMANCTLFLSASVPANDLALTSKGRISFSF